MALLTGACKKADKQVAKSAIAGNTLVTEPATKSDQTPNTAAQIYAKTEVPVLCYHRIADGPKGDYKVSQATFAAHVKILAEIGRAHV